MAIQAKMSTPRSNKGYNNARGALTARKRPAGGNNETSKKSFVDQKLAKKQRKMQRPHYEMVTRAKQIWNVIRERDVDKDKRATLVNELFTLVKGKIYDVAAKHDASRVIQSLMQHGKPAHRSQIVLEMKEHLIEVAKMQYGCFLVQKMIRYGSIADRATIVKCLIGHVVQVGTHNIAANVLEYAQEYLNPSQLTTLKLEFYGREFAYFQTESKRNLTDIIAAHPDKKADVLKHLGAILNRMVDKQLLGLAFVQSLLWEYMCNAEHNDVMQMVANVRDASLALLATRNGARVVNKCVSLGAAKDRKRIIKSLKDKVLEACNHPSGYLVIMRILDVVDDSILVQKSILAEINDELLSIALHPSGRKILLQLLSPLNNKYLSADDFKLLEPPMLPSPEDPTVNVVNYKKDPDARREELLLGLLPKLVDMCAKNVEVLMRSKEGRDVIVEVAKRCDSLELLDSISSTVMTQRTDEEKDLLYNDAIGHYALRRLIKETALAEPLLVAVEKQLSQWAISNRGSFVVLAFLEAENSPQNTMEVVKRALKPVMKDLRKLVDTQKGTMLLLEKLQ
ncbi:peptidase [Plasmopara halstedii]|uniref:Peptidase n=1 Tax=Plasmopara halstedii TaxID=4781 RepID=A0A0P1ADL5_PLAHL|nr:peptidase [Plasmopara halstedii]CEG38586.1 peptidase [Plasmopara halstedii]|eukprot:XP_024574955.1 peptidase [Plasmopara halstedii]